MRCVFAVVLLATSLVGQRLAPVDVRERYEKGLPLWEIEYMVDDKGELWMCPSPDFGADDQFFPAFHAGPNLMRSLVPLGGVGTLNLLFMGPRDLASLGDPTRGLSLMGPLPDVAALRQRIASAVEEATPERERRVALERLLAVRWLQEHRVEEARGELMALAKEVGADRFLRRAAEDALRALDGKRSPPAGVSVEVLAAVPAGADLVLFIDQGRVPAPFFMLRVTQQVLSDEYYREILAGGGKASRATMAGAQWMSDVYSMVPFEIARRYGNARFDRVVGALKILDRRPAVWLDAAGMFDPEGLATLMVAQGGAAEVEGGRLTAELPQLLKVTADRNHLRIAVPGAGKPGGAANAARLRAAGLGKGAPIWVHVPENSSLIDFGFFFPKPKSAVLEITFDNGMEIAAVTQHPSVMSALTMAMFLEQMRLRFLKRLEVLKRKDERLVPVVAQLDTVLRGARLEVKENTVSIALEIRVLDLDQLPALILALR